MKSRKMWAGIYAALGFGSAFQQITEKDMQAAYSRPDIWAGYTWEQKAKYIFGRFLNRTTGFSLFPAEAGTLQFKINPWGWANKWTALGAIAIIYNGVSHTFNLGLPHSGKAKGLGGAALTGGIIGGLLDDTPNSGTRTDTRIALENGPRRSAW